MALKRLSVEEMIEISLPWTTEGNPAQAAIEKVPMLAALWPELQAAHAAISALWAQQENPKPGELLERERTLSADHDRRARGIYCALTALAQVPGASAEVARLRYALFPEGLAHSLTTHRGRAGRRTPVRVCLDDDLQMRLKAVNIYDKNLLDVTREWLAIAGQIGDVQAERARHDPASPLAARIEEARTGWIRIASIMLASAELAGVDQATDHLLFGRLRAAEQAADERSWQEAETPTPTTAGPPSRGKPGTPISTR